MITMTIINPISVTGRPIKRPLSFGSIVVGSELGGSSDIMSIILVGGSVLPVGTHLEFPLHTVTPNSQYISGDFLHTLQAVQHVKV